MYAPVVKFARRVRQHQIDAQHAAVLLADIEAVGSIRYKFLLAIFRAGQQDPIAIISSEFQASRAENLALMAELGLEEDDVDVGDDRGPQSYFLGVFHGGGHSNQGSRPEWGDEATFEARALVEARKLVGR
jgi:hypothetical protein